MNISDKYLCNTIGRRKEATARLWGKSGTGRIIVNGKEAKDYFYMDPNLPEILRESLYLFNKDKDYDFKVLVNGGGFTSQARAALLAISRFLATVNPENRLVLKQRGFLSCHSFKKEREKIGQLKARKKYVFRKR